MENWRGELTITPECIAANLVRVWEAGGLVRAFYSMVTVPTEKKLGEVVMEKGVGRQFFDDIGALAETGAIEPELRTFVDPNARGFYEAMGATFVRDSWSSIPGRCIPVYRWGADFSSH